MKNCVIHICDFAAAYKGNFMGSLLALENYLIQHDIQQIYVFPQRAKMTNAINWINELRHQGHTVFIQSNHFFKNLKLLKNIKNQYNVTAVFRHFNNLQSDVLAKLIFPQTKTIHFFHGMYNTSSAIKQKIKEYLYKNNTLVGVSDAVSENLKAAFSKNEVITVKNAVDFSRLNLNKKNKKNCKINCLVMGYDINAKGTDLAIDAVKELQKDFNLHLNIVAASHLVELNNLLTEKCVKENDMITILPPTENISQYYSNTDIFLAPSRTEGFSYSVVETAFCKITTVLSDISAHKQLNVDKRFIFESENSDDFSKNLSLAIKDLNNEKSALIKEKIKAEVIKEYSLEIWCEKVFKLI